MQNMPIYFPVKFKSMYTLLKNIHEKIMMYHVRNPSPDKTHLGNLRNHG